MVVGYGSHWLGFSVGGLGRSMGMCCSGYGVFWDAAGLRELAGFGNLGLWLGNRVFEDVLLNWSDVLSGPAIPLALGLYVITAQGGCAVNNGSGDVDIFCWDRNSTSWPKSSYFNTLVLWALSKYCFWFYFLGIK